MCGDGGESVDADLAGLGGLASLVNVDPVNRVRIQSQGCADADPGTVRMQILELCGCRSC